MIHSKNILATGVACCLITLISGCMAYRTGRIPDAVLNKQAFTCESKPTTHIEVKCQTQSFNEEVPGKNIAAAQKFKGLIAGVLKEPEPFKSYTFTENRNQQTDLKIVFSFQRVEKASLANILLTAGTFTIIPAISSMNYSLTAQIYDSTGKEIGTYKTEDSLRVWFQILLLPLGSYRSPDKEEKQLVENLTKTTLLLMNADGLLNIQQ